MSRRAPPPRSILWIVRPAICLLLCTLATAFMDETQRQISEILEEKFGGTTRPGLQFERVQNTRQASEASQKNWTVCRNDTSRVEVAYWPQKLDNFDPNNNATWKQHYQVQRKYFEAEGDQQTIFVMIGGEDDINSEWICEESLTHMQLAKKPSALVVQLEHRFFGHNQGTNELSIENLQYLTIEQAMADLTNFITGFVKQQKFENPKVVTIAGSYAGTLAAFHRLVYPHVTQGAIASSAPLHAKLDFWEYAHVMEEVIKATNEECYENTRDAFAALLTDTHTRKGRAYLNELFSLIRNVTEPPKEELDAFTFAVFRAFQGIVQYSFIGVESLKNQPGIQRNIAFACKVMNNDKFTLLKRLSLVHYLANRYEPSVLGGANRRGWVWLLCNEFGWHHSTSHSTLFKNVVPLGFLIKECEHRFNLTREVMRERVCATYERYGHPDDFNATNVFLPNGGFDPVHALGVLTNRPDNAHMISRVTPGAAHCAEFYAYYQGEPAGLNETRQMLYDEIEYYLSLPSSFKATKGVGTAVLSFITLIFSLFVSLHFH